MTYDHIHREEAPHVGDPDDVPMHELAGIAPPCDECGQEEAVDGRGLCHDCLEEADDA